MFTSRKDRNFRFLETETELGKTFAINVIRGKWKDVVFYYGAVRFIEEDDRLRLKFTYDVIRNERMKDTSSQEFMEYAGKLLEYLINNHSDKVSFLNDEELKRPTNEN